MREESINREAPQDNAQTRFSFLRPFWLRPWLRRLVIYPLTTLILLALIIWGGAWAWCVRFTPTGDALFDRYARTVLRQQAWKLFTSPDPLVVPDRELAGWEKDFSQDSRYWELRYWCRDITITDANFSLRVDEPYGEHLLAARERGVASWEALARCYLILRARMWRQQQEKLENIAVPHTLDGGSVNPEWLSQVAAINREAEQLEIALLSEAVVAAPDQAWPYYLRANYRLNLAEDESALADLSAGNAAPDCAMPYLFPYSFVMDRIDAGLPAGSPLISGAILERALRTDYRNFGQLVKFKELYKNEAVCLNLGGPRAMTQALHQAACRLALADRGDRSNAVIGAFGASVLAATILRDGGDDFSSDQLTALQALSRLRDEVELSESRRTARICGRYPGLLMLLSEFEVLTFEYYPGSISPYALPEVNFNAPDPGEVSPGTYFAEMYYRFSPAPRYRLIDYYFRQERAWSLSQYQAAFEEAQLFDFATLSFPLDWDRAPLLN